MKRKIVTFLLLALLLISLSLGSLALSAGGMPLVADSAGLLTESENDALNGLADTLSAKYGCEIVVVTVSDLDGWSVEALTEAVYTQYGFGYGEEKSGVILLLSMEERDFDIAAYGYGNTAFTDYGKEQLMGSVLPYLGKDNWYGGFSAFIELCGSYLEAARNGEPVDVSSGGVPAYRPAPSLSPAKLIAALAIGLIAAFIVSGAQKSKMKSAVLQTRADRYMDELKLTANEDRFLRTTRTKTPRASSSSSGGSRSGGGTHVNSSGFSHHSGKF